MKLRVARHTTDLNKITAFYCDVLGLERLGGFEGHQAYDGAFLGLKGENWHLEFTVSNELPNHTPDEDDLLVFYVDDRQAYDSLLLKIKEAGLTPIQPKNPYWQHNGTLILDPDGFGVMITVSE